MKEYKRQQIKRKSLPFCSNTCTVIYKNLHKSSTDYENLPQCKNLRNFAGNKKDEYSSFRIFINLCNQRKKATGINVDIDIKYLKELWETQNGKCPYTGLQMIIPQTTKEYQKIHSLEKASIDRIDPSKGYIKGNVEFVCMFINFAKSSYSKEQMINLISKIKSR